MSDYALGWLAGGCFFVYALLLIATFGVRKTPRRTIKRAPVEPVNFTREQARKAVRSASSSTTEGSQ